MSRRKAETTMLAFQQQPRSRSASPHGARAWRAGVRVIGGYFAGTAVLNTVYTVRTARDFLGWMAEHSWFPPYRGVFRALEPIAPAVVLGAAAFQAALAYHLLRGHRVSGTLRWAEAWVLGLIPALPWPYWTVNASSAVALKWSGGARSIGSAQPSNNVAWTPSQ